MSNAYDDSFMMVNYIIVCICIFSKLSWGGGGGGGLCFFIKILFLFSSDRKSEIFFSHSLRAKIFFQDKAKKKYFFSKQHICFKCILLDLYVRVFLEPNIHGYIVYMFVYTCIWDIWVRVCMYMLNLFFNFSYLVEIYPVDALQFT